MQTDFPRTAHSYLDLLIDYQKKVKTTPTSWPGDVELFTAYKSSTSEILSKINQILDEAKISEQISEAKFKQNALLEITLIDYYRISIYLTGTSTTACTECKVALLCQTHFKIYNIQKNIELEIPAKALHNLLNNDLGDKLELNIDPTIACKTLEIGDTNLPRNHPLYSIAQFSKNFYIEQSLNG